MFDPLLVMKVLGIIVTTAPFLLLGILSLSTLFDRKLSERGTAVVSQIAITSGFVASALVLAFMLITGERHVKVDYGDWVSIPHYEFSIKLIFDRLSIPFTLLTYILCGTIGIFATRYLHREEGFNRFFVLYSLFACGMVLAAVAGTIETLFAGWEMVGLSSALLVAFFQERPAPVRNGLRIWTVYRISDASLLLAAVVMHHLVGSGDFDHLFGTAPWPDETHSTVSSKQALVIGLLLLVAAAGKSALVPFSGWLPRAMEGPTPSSAVFYGALSVHLGAYLLLRASPLLQASWILATSVVVLGLITALFAYVIGSVQTDIKSALSYASLVQVGLIVAEIGLGFHYLPLVHLLGHACLRTMQFLRAPSLLRDYHKLEDAIGDHLPTRRGPIRGPISDSWRIWLYQFSMERGYLDSFLNEYIVNPLIRLLHWCDRMERRWTNFLKGQEPLKPSMAPIGQLEEFS